MKCSFFIVNKILKKMHHDFHKNIRQHLFSAFANKKILIFYIIKIFFVCLCDIEDWSNACWKFSFFTSQEKHLKDAEIRLNWKDVGWLIGLASLKST